MHRIPVTLARRPGYEDEPDSYISPVVEIEVEGATLSSSDTINHRSLSLKIKALVDTGGDQFHFDESVLNHVGAQYLGPSATTTITMHGETRNHEYCVLLSFPGTDIKFRASVVARNFPGNARAYQAIIGMELIRIGKLVIDPSGDSYLELPPY